MAVHVMSRLASHLNGAYRIVETVVLRSKEGEVFAIEVGNSLLTGSHTHTARVTQLVPRSLHLGFCQGYSVEEVLTSAQHLVADWMAEQASLVVDEELEVVGAP